MKSWPHTKAKTAIKLLALQPGRALHREQLLEALWPDAAPRVAANRLRVVLHRLRSALAGAGVAATLVERQGSSLRLYPDTWTDVDTFRERAADALRLATDPDRYVAALDLYPGDLLPQDALEEWTIGPRDELCALRRRLLAEVATLLQLSGDDVQAERRLLQLLETDPLDEATHRQLMLFYARSGRREQAVAQYDRCRALLQEHIGVGPAEETERLYREVSTRGRSASSVAASPAGALVGREQEFAQLRQAMGGAIAGRSGVILLEGEPGIGKTRLAEELTTYARIQGASVAWGSCHEDGASAAYWPWVQITRAYSRDDHRSGTDRFAGFDIAGRVTSSVSDESERGFARLRLFEQFLSFVKKMTAQRPALFLIEDIQWADTASLALLQFLARATRDVRVLVLCTYRANEIAADDALRSVVLELDQLSSVSRMSLEGLSEAETGSYIESLTKETSSSTVRSNVFERTEGNPFFIQQLVRLFQTQGVDLSETDKTRLPVPDTVRHVIGRRLQRLSPECIRTLTIAAVAGREFTLGLLEAAADRSREQLLEAVDEASAAGLVLEVEGAVAGFRFVHALVRETLFEDIPLSRRIALHRRVGEALERVHRADLKPYYDELAHHFSSAAAAGALETKKAIDYATQAGLLARDVHAHEDAVKQFRRALALLETGFVSSPYMKYFLQIQAGWAERRSGNIIAAKEMHRAAFDTAKSLRSPDAQASAAFAYGLTGFGSGAVDGAYVSMLEMSLEALGPEDHALGARLRCFLARALYWSDQPDRCFDLAREGVAMARRLGDQDALADCLWSSFFATWSPDTLPERLEFGNDLLAIGRASGKMSAKHEGHMLLAIAHLETGDPDTCEGHLDASARISTRRKDPYYLVAPTQGRAALATLQGRLEEGERLAHRVLELNQRISDPDAAAIFGVQLALVRWEQGRLAEIEPFAKNFVDEYPTIPSWRAALAWIYREQDNDTEARREFEAIARSGFTTVRKDNSYLLAVVLLSDVAAYLNDHPRIAQLYEMLRPYRDRNVVITYAIGCAGPTSLYLGELATALGRWDEAEEVFDEARTMAKRLGSPTFQNRIKVERARMLLARRCGGDEEEACALLEGAIADAITIGQSGLVSKAQPLLDGSHVRRQTAPTER